MTDYKQLAKELYETLKQVRKVIDDANGNPISRWDKTMPRIDAAIEYYEQETTRGTGRTTALYMKAISEALANPGERVEFVDHSPINFSNALSHQNTLRSIIAKLGYDIEVFVQHSMHDVHNKIILINKFLK